MFDRILLPVDLSDQNGAAVAAARELIGDSRGSAILLHVIETIADAPFEDLEDFYQRLERKAHTRLKDLAEELAAGEVDVEQRVVYGKRVREIVAYAQDLQADLVILSTRPLDPDNPQVAWGSISNQVAILAPCPVLLIK